MFKIKEIRESKKISLKALAKLSGISDGYISELETGKKTNPTFETIDKIAKALNVTVSELLNTPLISK
jgi:transcriptional regulator with XRE-family HTH domain